MSHRIDAIFENGVFRPEIPVNIPNGERVSLDVERIPAVATQPASDGAARRSFEKCFGSVDLGHPVGIENSQIDTDLSRAYQADNGPA